jgi:hypothetical protein
LGAARREDEREQAVVFRVFRVQAPPRGRARCPGRRVGRRDEARQRKVRHAAARREPKRFTRRVRSAPRKVRQGAQVRSISHWSPYDRVGVVDADP